MGVLVALILYILVAAGGIVLGPFSGNGVCQSYRFEVGAVAVIGGSA